MRPPVSFTVVLLTALLFATLTSTGPSTLLRASPQAAQPTPSAAVTVAGELVIEPPTLINLGFEWFIQGDANRNASVAVSFRKQGQTAWQDALPLLRLQGERIYAESRVDVIAPNMFAGSVLDLEPDTAYEVQLVLADPDGVTGQSRRVITVRTRREPAPYRGGRTFHVYPHGFKGQKIEPAFEGLMCAYNEWCAGTDWATSGRPRVRPGDTILVHAGIYKYNRYEYTNDASVNRTVPLDGTYYLTADGTPEMPIAIVAAGDGEVVFDGNGNFALFDVRAADYTYFEGITFRNAEIAINAGTQFLIGSKGLSVKRSRFENVGAGVFTNYSGSSGFYVADSTFIGRNDPKHLIGWAGEMWTKFRGVEGQIVPPAMASYVAVKLYGPGHIVAHNYIADFHDGINVETYGNPDGSVASGPGIVEGPKYPTRDAWDRRPVAIDFYGNYITNSHDNPIEADGSMHNIRIMRNMFINHASHAFCNQPTLGGPVYWIRNIAYHLPAGSTRLTNGAAGVLFYNNTILAETAAGATSNTHWRNNLMLGENALPAIFSVTTFTNYTSSDYNGFRPNAGAATSFEWSSPPAGTSADFTAPGRTARLETRRFPTLAEYSKATGQDVHSVLLDYDVFVKVPQLDAQDAATVQRLYDARDLDFRLRSGSAAVDRGIALPTVTNGFSGRAPDLGALESGAPLPVYGVRR
ncbi:MAG TPA: hypothetical protein VM819_11715 [Vicinamibacterales bacterium]|nr:hypothetical protein [Vicinamibacterales bacterium]